MEGGGGKGKEGICLRLKTGATIAEAIRNTLVQVAIQYEAAAQ